MRFGNADEFISFFDIARSASLVRMLVLSERCNAVAACELAAPMNTTRRIATPDTYTLQSCEPISEAKRSASRSCHGLARHWAKLTVRDRRKSSSKI